MQNISNNSFINQPINFFKERLVPMLSALLAKIKVIAMTAFELIAYCFMQSKPTPSSLQRIYLNPSASSNSSHNTLGINGRNDASLRKLNLERPDNQSNTSITDIAVHSARSYDPDASMRTAMINLDVWVNAGNPNERRQVAKDRIMEFLNGSQEMCDLSSLNLYSLPNIFIIPAFPERLKVLKLWENLLTKLPPEIGQLTRLETLDLRLNRLETLPPEIGQLTRLETLDLTISLLLETLPPEIGQLTRLETLDLRFNRLETLPPEIGQLTRLETLDLRFNRLETLPPEIGQLTRLEQLRLSSNPLVGLPLELMNLPRSCTICIECCNFTPAVLERVRNQTRVPGYAGPRFSLSMAYANPQVRQDLTVETLLQNLFHEVNEPYVPMTKILEENLSQASLQHWLSRLSYMRDYNSSPERKQWLINKIIQHLKLANESESFRKRFFSIIEGAAATCGDRIALSILHLGIAYRLATIDRREMKQLATFLARGVWAMSMLETIARNKVETLPFFDEIEVYLAYPIMLKERLLIPIDVEGMLFYGMSGVKSSDLDEAYSFVSAKLADQGAYYNFLIHELEWTNALQINYPDQYAAIEMEKNEQLDHAAQLEEYEKIEKTYRTKLLDLTSIALSETRQAASSSAQQSS